MPTTLLQYARIAQAVYNEKKLLTLAAGAKAGSSWMVRRWMSFTDSDGFQGAILESVSEVVCAFKGSMPPGSQSAFQDWCVNDLQIGLNMVPSQTAHAKELVRAAQHIAGNKPITIVGHSLGGGLAQLVGFKLDTQFVTFNGPGMYQNIQKVAFLPGGALIPYAIKKAKGTKAKGFNMIITTDPVGNYGVHIGKTERFSNRGTAFPHKMEAVLATLEANQNNNWASKDLGQLLA